MIRILNNRSNNLCLWDLWAIWDKAYIILNSLVKIRHKFCKFVETFFSSKQKYVATHKKIVSTQIINLCQFWKSSSALGIKTETKNRSVEILQQSRHDNLYCRQLNLKDCNFPSKKGIDEVIPHSPENSSTTPLLSQTKRRIRNHLVHRRTNQTYNSIY